VSNLPVLELSRRASAPLARGWRQLAASRTAVVTCFVWALGEATVWPVIPDVALFVFVLAAPARAPRPLLATAAGAAAGGTLTVLVASLAPHAATSIVLHVPLVHAQSVGAVRSYLRSHTLIVAFLHQPWSGIPFKLWAVTAVADGRAPLLVIACFILGRSLRFATAAIVAGLLGRLLQRRLEVVAVPLLILAGPSAGYLFYTVAIA
jgi:membrane protein YqaA with SNARE-associated domain